MKQKKLVSTLVKKVSNSLGKTTLILATFFCSTLPAQAVNINFTYGDGVNKPKFKNAAEAAALYWEDRLNDDVTINIHLDIPSADQLPDNVLGGALPGFVSNVNYYNFQNALKNDRSSSYDNIAVANLPSHGDSQWRSFVDDIIYYSSKINLTRANAKALGLIDKHHSDLDGIIILSDLRNIPFGWKSNRTYSVGDTNYDYTSVLIHEIGHILGFVSVIDSINASNFYNYTERQKYVTPFNLFTGSSFTQNSIIKADMSYGEDLFFTIDGSQTNLGYLSTGQDKNLGTFGKGDGNQGSHWKDDINAIMNPILARDTRRDATSRDLKVLDVIGWDVNYNPNLSTSDIVSQGKDNAIDIGNTNKNYGIEKMLNQYRWGGASRSSRFHQGMDLTDYLAQEGVFQKGTFWSYYDVLD